MKSKKKNISLKAGKKDSGTLDTPAFNFSMEQDSFFPQKHARAREIVSKVIWLDRNKAQD